MPTSSALPAFSRRASAALNFAFSYAGVALMIVQGIVLVPLYVSRVPPVLYGAWLATGNLLTWLELVDPGVSDVLRQRVASAYGADDRASLARSLGTGLPLNFLFALVPLAALPFAGDVGRLVHLPPELAAELATSVRIGIVGVSLTMASYGVAAVCGALQLALSAGLWFTAISVAGILATVALLYAGFGLASIPAGLALRGALMLATYAALVWRWTRAHLPERVAFDRGELRLVVTLSLATFTARLGTALLERVDAFMVSRVAGNVRTITYALTGRAFDLVRGLAISAPSALVPSLAHMSGADDRAKISEVVAVLTRVSGWVVAVAVGSAVALDGVFVRLWVARGIYGGPALAAALGVSTAMVVFSGSLNRVIYALGAIQRASRTALAEAAIKVPLQYVLLRWLGLPGLPLAAAVASLSMSGWVLPGVLAERLGESPAAHRRQWARNVARVLVAVLAGWLAQHLIDRLGVAWTWPKLAVSGVVVGGLFTAAAFALDAGLRGDARRGFAALRRARRAGTGA